MISSKFVNNYSNVHNTVKNRRSVADKPQGERNRRASKPNSSGAFMDPTWKVERVRVDIGIWSFLFVYR